MIVNDTHRFVFVHIPKCAGTTVRDALAAHDEGASRFHDKSTAPHRTLGMLDHAHIPLAVLRAHFPDDFARLAAYRSFALIRDPHARFPSSLHERFVQRERAPLAGRELAEVAREVDEVIARLARLPRDAPVIEPDLIHFSRQSDYVFLDGEKVVGSLRTVAEMDDLLAELSTLIGAPVRPEEAKNRRVSHVFPAVERLQLLVTRPIEAALPRRIWKPLFRPIKQAFISAGLLRQGGDPLAALPNASDIRDFVSEFYADDIELFETLNAGRRSKMKIDGIA